uniref:WGS project CAEQ00000000 data, annotated contig 243 n=1 Tax=Trypanosoma congolense (strain IL3000) TaxID=1068625 RepID=F9WE32_TRYCI|nr:unnamed protein product [Trypanosoma congolense IL3000]
MRAAAKAHDTEAPGKATKERRNHGDAHASPDSDGEPVQEEQKFVCQKCDRVLKSRTWLTRHKCTPSSNPNSENSTVAEQSDTAACTTCSKQYHYKWLLRQIMEKHTGHDESLRPQPRAKPKRKTMRSEAPAQGGGGWTVESVGGGDGERERPRKRPRMGRHKEGEEERDYVCGRCDSAYRQWYSLVWHTPTHHGHAATVKGKMKDGTVAVTPLLQRSIQCPYRPVKCDLKQHLTMHLQAKHGQRKKEAEHTC